MSQSESSAPTLQKPSAPRFVPAHALLYLLVGIYFGFVITKSEVISWYRIQEMFRFQSFHMYGVLSTGILTAVVGTAILKRLRPNSLSGDTITLAPKTLGKGYRYVIGGILFGLGWALVGACPGPLFALVGTGKPVMVAALLSALAGTWLYSLLRPRLPH